MIVHIASDEKFINSAYWQFQNIEYESVFYIIVSDTTKELKYVDLKERMFVISKDIRKLKSLGKFLINTDLVCFHGLDYYSSLVLNSLPKYQKVLWFLFGKEIYNNPFLYNKKDVFGEKTYTKFFHKSFINRSKELFKNYTRGLYYQIKNRTYSPFYEVTKAIKRANYCGILYEEEFQLVKKKLGTKIAYVKFSYYPIEKMVPKIEAKVSGVNILLGNSASHTNNHLEAFELLRRMDIKGRKIITPLSYGNELYKREILREGKKILKDYFEPLLKFMPLHEYNTYIQQCSIVIMNHYRQQAVGNVLILLWFGAKVYLDNKNTLYHYLKRLGVYVYDISEELKPENREALERLTEKQQLHNKNCLKKEINQEFLLHELKEDINMILCL